MVDRPDSPAGARPRAPSRIVIAVVALAGLGMLAPPPGLAAGTDAARTDGPGGPQPAFVPGELIVAFGERSHPADRHRALAAVGGEVTETLPLERTRLIEIDGGPVRASADELEAEPGVRYAQPNYFRSADALPRDPMFPSLWGLNNTGQSVGGFQGTADADIDAPEAWDLETGSASTAVAVVDSGVELPHPDLAANAWANPGEAVNGGDDDGNGKADDVHGWDFVDADPDPSDPLGHGTHVAGTIGAVGDNGVGVTGVAWDVSLIAVRVLAANGQGTDADIASGFDYAAEEGARVVNASLTGPEPTPVIASAINAHPETLFVLAAGNNHSNNDSTPAYPCNVPAANVICVAASDSRDGLAYFSNYGSRSVDLAAPGLTILSTLANHGYGYLNGTSMATPHVSGVAALAVSMNPAITVAELRAVLLGSVDARPALAGRVASGGRLNAARALASVNLPPETTITTGPGGATSDATPTFRFASNEAGVSFECATDDSPFAPCSGAGEHTTPRLGDGEHSFGVRARDAEGAADPTPAERTFSVDTTAPETRIDSGPRRNSRDRTPTFQFSSPEASATFKCRIDRGPWRACDSPARYRVGRERHLFEVRAEDRLGNADSSPARYAFEVKRGRAAR